MGKNREKERMTDREKKREEDRGRAALEGVERYCAWITRKSVSKINIRCVHFITIYNKQTLRRLPGRQAEENVWSDVV